MIVSPALNGHRTSFTWSGIADTMSVMARTLRLPERIEAEVRRRAEASGRSQHQVIVDTLTQSFGLDTGGDARLESPAISPPETPFDASLELLPLPAGTSILGLLDREDRV